MLPRLLSFFGPRKLAALGMCFAVALASCTQNPVTVKLHAMQSSGKVSFVCRGLDNTAQGHKLDECPDYEAGTRHTMALVTQTVTNEVAVVDLSAQSIVDIDKTTPGYSFLRVGGIPGSIVTTPGGAATFVGVTGPEKNGIFALPTTCILPPTVDEKAARDLTTWTACHLSSEPGDIAVIVDPVLEQPGGGAADAELASVPRRSCLTGAPPDLPSQEGRECPADTTKEPGPAGRRKLLVALPREHKLVLLDAQRLLDQEQGAFPECQPEATYALKGEIPAAYSQDLPKDLQPATSAMCAPTAYTRPDASAPATPGGFAALGDRVYVADSTRSVVHVLDVSDPCNGTELPALLPLSYEQPWRAVKTSRLAVSPLSITSKNPQGKQFLYAIDQDDQPAASIMVFDLTKVEASDPNSRTPLIFDGSSRQPYMPADRLRFGAPVQDVSFVLRDFPKPDSTTGAGEFGLLCEPDPSASGPGTLYRPNSDFSDGARPINLRGLFGFAMLTNGQIAVIDADDFDAPCRRPVTSNMSMDVEDIHGCKNDGISTPFELNGTPTVTNESSCRIVEPHRPRSASLSISSTTTGVRAPSLRTFPQFSTPSSSVPLDKQPRMMATDLVDPNDPSKTLPAEVNVGSQPFANCASRQGADAPPPCNSAGTSSPLEIDPKAEGATNSLTLPLVEPRSYTTDQSLALVYEGQLFPARSSGFLDPAPDPSRAVLVDPDGNFCGAGVEDSETIRTRGSALGIPESSLDAWAEAHADYVQITGDFPRSDDVYWTVGRGSTCAGLINPTKPTVPGRDACASRFGNIDNLAVLNTRRNLSVLEASAGQLLVQPQNCTGDSCQAILEQVTCCFPAGTAYTVRASNQWLVTGGGVGLHDIGVGAGNRCVHTASCDRRKELYGQRVFEVCDPAVPFESHTDENGNVVVDSVCDQATNPKVGCVAGVVGGTTQIPVQPNGPASQCIFENLTSRFVVYRGAQPNIPNMTFSWQTTGGFVPQTISMLALSSSVSPQSLNYLPQPGYLAVVDASTVGLALFDLNSLGVVLPSPYY